jgi:hypothetical protein
MTEQIAITAGHKPGTSVQELQIQWSQRAPILNHYPVLSCAAMANSKVTKKQWRAPFKGRMLAALCTSSNTAAASSALVDINNITQSNAMLAAPEEISGFTLNTQTALTPNATAANLEFEVGDIIEVSWTTDGSGTVADSQVQLAIEPRD